MVLWLTFVDESELVSEPYLSTPAAPRAHPRAPPSHPPRRRLALGMLSVPVPYLVIGRNYMTERDSAPAQYNGVV